MLVEERGGAGRGELERKSDIVARTPDRDGHRCYEESPSLVAATKCPAMKSTVASTIDGAVSGVKRLLLRLSRA